MGKNNYNNVAKNAIFSWYKNSYLNRIENGKKISKNMCKKFIFNTSLFNCSKTNLTKANRIFHSYYETHRKLIYIRNKRFVNSTKTKEAVAFNSDIDIERALRYLYHADIISLKKDELEKVCDAFRIAIDDTLNTKEYKPRKMVTEDENNND